MARPARSRIMNTNSTTQDYRLTYWNQSGSLTTQSSLSLSPGRAWYASQAVDPALPAGL